MTTAPPLFPLCCNIAELKELGPGIPLYYWFVKWLIIATFMIFCVAGIACTISNYYSDHSLDWTDSTGRIIRSSIGGQGNPYNRSGAIPTWYPLLHIACMILLIIGFRIWRGWAYEREYNMDIDITTPSDYTVWIRGLADNFDIEDLKNFF